MVPDGGDGFFNAEHDERNVDSVTFAVRETITTLERYRRKYNYY